MMEGEQDGEIYVHMGIRVSWRRKEERGKGGPQWMTTKIQRRGERFGFGYCRLQSAIADLFPGRSLSGI
ncbi:hypothetical protein CsSME_00027131 [Camellia sinensis var. sinensis]